MDSQVLKWKWWDLFSIIMVSNFWYIMYVNERLMGDIYAPLWFLFWERDGNWLQSTKKGKWYGLICICTPNDDIQRIELWWYLTQFSDVLEREIWIDGTNIGYTFQSTQYRLTWRVRWHISNAWWGILAHVSRSMHRGIIFLLSWNAHIKQWRISYLFERGKPLGFNPLGYVTFYCPTYAIWIYWEQRYHNILNVQMVVDHDKESKQEIVLTQLDIEKA